MPEYASSNNRTIINQIEFGYKKRETIALSNALLYSKLHSSVQCTFHLNMMIAKKYI